MTIMPLSMRRNCNLELCLLPSSASLPIDSADSNQNHHHPMMAESNTRSPQQQHQQQLTIFYNGKVCVCDATEFQARAIILLARREMEERMIMKTPTNGTKQPSSSEPLVQSPAMYSPTTGGLSMKRSLQRFLQKRNHRIHETSSPYHR